MMHEALRNDADCGGAHPHAQHYVPFASEITPLISAMVIARKGGGGGTGVRGRKRSVVPESHASQLKTPEQTIPRFSTPGASITEGPNSPPAGQSAPECPLD